MILHPPLEVFLDSCATFGESSGRANSPFPFSCFPFLFFLPFRILLMPVFATTAIVADVGDKDFYIFSSNGDDFLFLPDQWRVITHPPPLSLSLSLSLSSTFTGFRD